MSENLRFNTTDPQPSFTDTAEVPLMLFCDFRKQFDFRPSFGKKIACLSTFGGQKEVAKPNRKTSLLKLRFLLDEI